jgi:hypothetical protein
MRTHALIVGLLLLVPVSTARAQEEAQAVPVNLPAPAPVNLPAPVPVNLPAPDPTPAVTTPATVAPTPARIQVGVGFLPMLLGKVATVDPNGKASSSNLDTASGVGLSLGYRIIAGLSAGIAAQAVWGLSAKDSGGYPVIESEKEYDLMARIAYTYAVLPRLAVYAEHLLGYSFVTYNYITLGVQPPRAHGAVVGGGLGTAFDVTDYLFVNAGVGYQVGFQQSHGISVRDVKTSFLRIALGVGVKF